MPTAHNAAYFLPSFFLPVSLHWRMEPTIKCNDECFIVSMTCIAETQWGKLKDKLWHERNVKRWGHSSCGRTTEGQLWVCTFMILHWHVSFSGSVKALEINISLSWVINKDTMEGNKGTRILFVRLYFEPNPFNILPKSCSWQNTEGVDGTFCTGRPHNKQNTIKLIQFVLKMWNEEVNTDTP